MVSPPDWMNVESKPLEDSRPERCRGQLIRGPVLEVDGKPLIGTGNQNSAARACHPRQFCREANSISFPSRRQR